MRNVCTVEGCPALVQGRGFCPNHYQRWRRNGHPTESRGKKVQVRPDGRRNCTKCDAVKDPSEFGSSKTGINGLSSWCRECMRVAVGEYGKANRARRADRESVRRARTFGPGTDPSISRNGLRARDGDRCAYCLTVMDFSTYSRSSRPRNAASVDHILPLSRGGAHAWDNVVLCCIGCNVKKGDRPAPEILTNKKPLL